MWRDNLKLKRLIRTCSTTLCDILYPVPWVSSYGPLLVSLSPFCTCLNPLTCIAENSEVTPQRNCGRLLCSPFIGHWMWWGWLARAWCDGSSRAHWPSDQGFPATWRHLYQIYHWTRTSFSWGNCNTETCRQEVHSKVRAQGFPFPLLTDLTL